MVHEKDLIVFVSQLFCSRSGFM